MEKPITYSWFRDLDQRKYLKENIIELGSQHENIKKLVYSNILNNRYVIDSLEIARTIGYYECEFDDILFSILDSRRNYILKLEVLDYLLTNAMLIKEYEKICIVSILDSNPLVRFQGKINLLIYNADEYIYFFLDPQNYSYSFFYYRLINNMIYNHHIKNILLNYLVEIRQIVSTGVNITLDQKEELLKLLNSATA